MLGLVKIAVTGGLSSGKSTVCRLFKELGAFVVSTDEIVHQLLSPTTACGQQVLNLLGTDILENQQIDRSLIAKKVFQNPKQLDSLEKILHPIVGQELNRLYHKICKEEKVSLFVVEIPLLFEIGGKNFFSFDYSIAVIADDKQCEARYVQAGYDIKDYEARMARQLSQDEKALRADFVINNNHSMETLNQKVIQLFNLFTNPNGYSR